MEKSGLKNRKWLAIVLTLGSLVLPVVAEAHGFNANRISLTRDPNTGLYRVTIRYTHVEVGEYREAHVDFTSRKEALRVYWDLINGADFFLGDVKSTVHFHNPPARNNPY